jgi:hypothetical protein
VVFPNCATSATHLMLRLAAYPEGMLEILITPGAVAIH